MNPPWSVKNFRIKNWIIKYEKKGIKNMCFIILNDDDNIFSEIFNQNEKMKNINLCSLIKIKMIKCIIFLLIIFILRDYLLIQKNHNRFN